MALRLSDEEIWFWYTAIIDQSKSNYTVTPYCKKNNLDWVKFTNLRASIFSCRESKPKEYKDMMVWAELFADSGLKISDFCKENGVNKDKLSSMMTHLEYQKVIERMKKQKEITDDSELTFVQIKSPEPKKPIVVEASHQVTRNDIEIKISSGLRVIISPEIESVKIIKIIEFLKDI